MSKHLLFATVSLAALVADQLTKWYAKTLHVNEVLSRFLKLEYTCNSGVAFSLMAGSEAWRRPFFIAVGAIALAGVLHLVARTASTQRRFLVGLGLIAGGAVGNLVDRVWHGCVTDFVVLHVAQHRWPTFNVADAALLAGVALLLWDRLGKVGAGAELSSG